MNGLSIGSLAAETGSSVQTIRYYEQIGLLPPAGRTEGNQRRYGRDHVARLAFVRHSRELGFPLEAIRELLSLSDTPERDCNAADEIARRQLKAVEDRIKRLRALRTELKRMIAECSGGKISECHVIEVLGDSSHGHCVAHRHSAPEPALASD
ncbi:helix-turn-helix domain-containing protein [Dongia sp.]|uniref:MerR family transcriptional regulator n=1 Tax=Dongia sp. TaxID=1977262 RepID=UPI00375059C4